MASVRSYFSLIKFSHTIFALPFALIGFFLGVFSPAQDEFYQEIFVFYRGAHKLRGNIDWLNYMPIFIYVILCMVFARSAAMAFNRYLDRTFDAQNPRTAIREIPSGIISANNALLFTIASSLLFIVSAYMINLICFALSPIALFIVLGYSFTKRFTPLCHLILGLGLALAPIGAYLAVTGKFDTLPIIFSLIVLFWVSGFDIIYALQDIEFDKSVNLYSIPAAVGPRSALHISRIFHIVCGALVFIAGYYGEFTWIYFLGALIFMNALLYQHQIVSHDDLRRVNVAFMTVNGIASIVFAIFVIADLFFGNRTPT